MNSPSRKNKAKSKKNGGQKQQQQVARQPARPIAPGKLSSAPVAQGRKNQMPKAKMVTSPNGNCRIRHREYIRDLLAEGTSPSLFSVTGLPINPGLPQTFPWLSQIAPRFEKYRFYKLHFDYETEAPTALGGSVILTVDYDASDPQPQSKVQAMAYKNAVRSPPWEEACHVSAQEDLSQQKAYFVRDGALAPNSDVKMYDVGNLFACSQNIATGGATLGELYVDYDVELITPQLQLPSVNAIDSIVATATGGTQTPALPMSNSVVFLSSLAPDLLSYNNVTGVFTFNRATRFSLDFQFLGSVITATTWSGTLGVAITAQEENLINGAGDQILGCTSLGGIVLGIPASIGDTFKVVLTATTVTGGSLSISEQ